MPRFTDGGPWAGLQQEILQLHTAGHDIIMMGDFNLHVGQLSLGLARKSPSDRLDATAKSFLSLMASFNFILHTGTTTRSEGYTWLKGTRKSVIDLMFATTRVNVLDHVILPFLEVSDHAPLRATVELEEIATREFRRTESYSFYDRPPFQDNVGSESNNALVSVLNVIRARTVEKPKLLEYTDGPTISAVLVEMRKTKSIENFMQNPELQIKYQELYKEITQLRKRRRDMIRRQNRDLLLSGGPAAFWTNFRRISGAEIPEGIEAIPRDHVVEHFASLLENTTGVQEDVDDVDDNQRLQDVDDDQWDTWNSLFSEEEIKLALSRMRNSAKAEDNILRSQIREDDAGMITELFNDILTSGSVPDMWRRSVIVPLSKPGKRNSTDPTDLRGIALQPALKRLYSISVLNRLTPWAETFLPVTQSGFRPFFRTTENLFITRILCERYTAEDRTLYVAFVDLQKAFDNVVRTELWRKLRDLGAGGFIYRSLKSLYDNTTASVRSHRSYSEEIPVSAGVLQGDPLSPLLFIIYIYDLITGDPDDPKLLNVSIPQLALADDITLFSNTMSGLIRKITELKELAEKIGLRINFTKTYGLVLGRIPTNRVSELRIQQDVVVEFCAGVRYIGYSLSEGRWNSKMHMEAKSATARKTMLMLYALRKHLMLKSIKSFLGIWSLSEEPWGLGPIPSSLQLALK
ncbi:Protease [Orbilia brochopaga]|nr:Protease [Drechslerella brochopaga]